MPSTDRSARQTSPAARSGQASARATAVRYGPMSTVLVVVTYAEFAQS